jgi:methanogenic corrinoid protein MtbC1
MDAYETIADGLAAGMETVGKLYDTQDILSRNRCPMLWADILRPL